MTTRLAWQGKESVDRIADNLAKGRRTVLKLPPAYHDALRSRLYRDRRYRGQIDLSGSADLLARVSAVAGLNNLRVLETPLRDAGARLRLRSAPPQIVFEPAKAPQ